MNQRLKWANARQSIHCSYHYFHRVPNCGLRRILKSELICFWVVLATSLCQSLKIWNTFVILTQGNSPLSQFLHGPISLSWIVLYFRSGVFNSIKYAGQNSEQNSLWPLGKGNIACTQKSLIRDNIIWNYFAVGE